MSSKRNHPATMMTDDTADTADYHEHLPNKNDIHQYYQDGEGGIQHTRSISLSSLESFGCQDQDDEHEEYGMAAHEYHHRYHSLPCALVAEADEIEDQLRAMVKMESGYACPDYLARNTSSSPPIRGSSSSNSGGNDHRAVDEFCREQICEWCFRVSDYFGVRREVVAIAVSYLDRFLSKYPSNVGCDRKTFKLAATACLFTAMKVHEPERRNLHFLSILTNLSRGEFDECHLCEMEKVVLNALGWKVHPPAPAWYVHHYVQLAPFMNRHVHPDAVRGVLDLASFYTELAVMDYYFVTKPPSLVGLAALLEATEGLSSRDWPQPCRGAFEVVIRRVLPDLDAELLEGIRSRLRVVYRRSQEAEMQDEGRILRAHSKDEGHQVSSAEAASPVCVTRTGRT